MFIVSSLIIHCTVLDIISIGSNKFEIVETKNDKHFKNPIFDIKSSHLNGNIVKLIDL